ncbi:acyl carrier protein [Streptomyces sp. NPDC001700]|uniref:acyl carrier protein n=1 Tax=Streptomyces sp. NPDC059850 TaxID=3346970 RepID=UPI003658669E
MSRTEKIQQFIEERFLVEFGGDITADTDLFKEGVIDSFGYIQMMNFLEDEFAFHMDEADILTDVFVSLSSIDDFVSRKLAEPNRR